MGQKIFKYRRFSHACYWLTLLIVSFGSLSAYSAGLGALTLQSGSGQPFSVHIALTDTDPEAMSSSCVKAKLLSSDGVLIAVPQIAVSHDTLKGVIVLSLQQPLVEPSMIISLVAGCEQPVQRDYHVLLDTSLALAKYDMKKNDTEHVQKPQDLVHNLPISLQLSYELSEPQSVKSYRPQ